MKWAMKHEFSNLLSVLDGAPMSDRATAGAIAVVRNLELLRKQLGME
jgi:hypothetical protein